MIKMTNKREFTHGTCVAYIKQMMDLVNNMNHCPKVSDEDMDYVMSLLSTYHHTLENTFFAFQIASDPIPRSSNRYSYSYYGLQSDVHDSLARASEYNIGGDQYDQERRDESKNGAETGEDET